MDSNPGKTSTENIDEVILRLLKLKTGIELDYQTYAKKIKIKLASSRMVGAFIPAEEDELLREEFKRVRNKEGRFVILKSKKTKVSSPPPPPRSGGGGGSPPKTGSIAKAKSGKITADSYYYQNYVEPVNVKDVTKKTAKVSKQTDPLIRISNLLDSILNTLTNINNFDREQATRQRTDAENRRRGQRETDLESKSFEGIKKALSAITKPFQSIWDRIVNFITNVILGRIVIKLLEWFGDSKNQEKIQSIIRFLGDHWPTLLALYLRFGTGIGRFVGKLTRSLVKGSFKLVKLVAGLAAKLGLKRAGKLASFIGGPRGRAIATGVGIAADVAVTAGTAFGASKLFGGEDKKQEPVAPEPVQQFSGGGAVRIPKFAGGGFANFGNMFKGAGMGSMFGPMGMLAGAALGSGIPQEMFSGLVKGPGGPKDDKIAANLSNGEFVMSAGAVKKYGVGTLEAMNAAGGGTNIPKITNGSIYAAGGGLVGDIPLSTSYGTNPNDNTLRQAARMWSQNGKFGAEEDLFKTFKKLGGVADFEKMVGGKQNFQGIQQGMHGADDALDAIRRSAIEKLKGVNKPGSVTRSINALHSAEDILTDRIKDNRSQLRQTGSRLRTTRIDPSRMLPAAGQSSANAMREASKAAKNMRPPIPATSAIVPYTGGGLARAGVTGGLSVPQIRTNMNVSGGFSGLKSAGIEMLASYLIDRGFDKVNAMIIAKKIDEGKKLTGNKKENYIERLRNVVDREEKWQRGFGGVFDSIIRMGKGSSSQKLSKSAREILEGMGSGAYKGGGIVGGHKLKDQSFKDAPKTQIMTDDKGKPFVGYKALRSGKLVYVRGSQPGTGTTNPLEALGRMINPGAYNDIDKLNTRKKYEEASKNSVSSLKSRGASQATISRTQTRLNRSVPPLPRPQPKPIVAGGGMGGGRGSGSRPSSGSKAPSFNAKHSKGTSVSASSYGIMR
jgi:hypothetical protein